MEKVILYTAFTWLCPKCKRRNYVKGRIPDIDDETLQEIQETMGEDVPDGDFIEVPTEVVCNKCLEHFLTEDFEDVEY